MKNEDAREWVDDYVDGLLEDEQRVAFESCMADDDSLAQEVRALEELRREVSALPLSIQPSRDLWPQIRLELEDRASVINFGYARVRYPVLRYAMAAAALVLVVFGLSVMVDMNPVVEAPSPITQQTDDPELNRIEENYVVARDELLGALRERRELLDDETLAIVEANLAIIENAVTDIQLALSVQPEDPGLELMLLAAYRSEMDLLQRAVKLADES